MNTFNRPYKVVRLFIEWRIVGLLKLHKYSGSMLNKKKKNIKKSLGCF